MRYSAKWHNINLYASRNSQPTRICVCLCAVGQPPATNQQPLLSIVAFINCACPQAYAATTSNRNEYAYIYLLASLLPVCLSAYFALMPTPFMSVQTRIVSRLAVANCKKSVLHSFMYSLLAASYRCSFFHTQISLLPRGIRVPLLSCFFWRGIKSTVCHFCGSYGRNDKLNERFFHKYTFFPVSLKSIFIYKYNLN